MIATERGSRTLIQRLLFTAALLLCVAAAALAALGHYAHKPRSVSS